MSSPLTERQKEAVASVPQSEALAWDEVFYRKKRIDVYKDLGLIERIFTGPIARALPKDKKYIWIGEFGAGNGYVIKNVAAQLEQKGGRCIVPFGIDSNFSRFQAMKRQAPNVQALHADLLHLNLHVERDFFHAGLLRFVFPFVPKNDQRHVLKQIHDVLKPGGTLVVLDWGVVRESEEADCDRLLAAGAACRGGVTYNTSYERLRRVAEKVGFKVSAPRDLTHICVSYLTPETYLAGVQTTDDRKNALYAAFRAVQEKKILKSDGETLRVQRPLYSCIMKKKPGAESHALSY